MIQIRSFSRDDLDSRGKSQPLVLHCTINGMDKSVSKADLFKAIELSLPERGEGAEEPETPLFNRLGNPPEEISINGGRVL